MSGHCPFMTLNCHLTTGFPVDVRFIFHVCPVLALQAISLHLPSRRLVPCVSLSFPLHSPCFHFCPFHVPFSSPLFPFISRCFPVMSTSYFLPHFLALPCISSLLPNISCKKHWFSSVFAIRTSNNTEFFQIFGKRRQEAGASKKAGRGSRAWDPCFASPRTTFSGTSSNCRAVRGGPQTSGGGGQGGAYLLS